MEKQVWRCVYDLRGRSVRVETVQDEIEESAPREEYEHSCQ